MFLQRKLNHSLLIWFRFVLLRLACLALTTTWFVPDEIFQSVEVAYRMVFDRGQLTWEWLPQNALRSTAHPLLYASVFSLLKQLKLDSNLLIRWLPFFLQALVFSIADVFYLSAIKNYFRQNPRRSSIVFYLFTFNWFLLYCSARTLSNTLETALACVVLQLESSNKPFQSQLAFVVSLSIILRPTSLLLGGPIICVVLLRTLSKVHLFGAITIALRTLLYGSLPIILAFSLDSLYYGRMAFSLWNFVRFNVLAKGSTNFGTHPTTWYIVVALPSLLTIIVPVLAIVLIKNHRRLQDFRGSFYAILALTYLAVHSLIPHKEHRFLLPTLPFLFPVIATVLDQCMDSTHRIYRFLKVYVVLNVCVAIYLGTIHQRGPYATSSLLRAELLKNDNSLTEQKPKHILQVMPCFSMPMYSDFHTFNVELRMLECTKRFESGVSIAAQKDFVEESELFNRDPLSWLHSHWKIEEKPLYDIVVIYDKIYRKTEHFWQNHGYRIEHTIFHTHFTSSDDQDTQILILKIKN